MAFAARWRAAASKKSENQNMPVIKILPHPEYCPRGAEIEATPGTSLCEALLEHDIEIEHACEMSAALSLIHISEPTRPY